MNSHDTDVAIVGSGPYGLSVAAQLRARGVSFRIFGPPMKFWRDMPVGLNLKSLAFATNVFVPETGYTFPDWCRGRNLEDFEPCTMQSFAAYGMWMKDRFVPDAEPEEVTRVSQSRQGFDVTLASERRFEARRVVFATGLSYFASTPRPLQELPRELVSHTFFLSDYSIFRGKDVAVIGAGASAIEAGALVHEAGGSARIFVRGPEAVFHGRSPRVRPLLERIRAPITVLGAGRKHLLLQELPLAVHFLPEARRVRLVKGYLGPAAPWWIIDRIEGKVPIDTNTELSRAEARGSKVQLTFRRSEGAERTVEVDHVIAGTGYDVDVARLSYLDGELQARLRRTQRAPALSRHFESSVRGAYFVGPASAMSFGPLFRFVAGGKYAAPTVARHIAGGPVQRLTSAARGWRGALARSS